MDYIKAFVAQQGVNLLNTAAVRLGLGYSTRLALLSGFSSLMTGTFGAAIAVAMFPSLYLYSVVNNLDVSVPNWITDGVSWVVNTLRPAWYGIVNGVQSWQYWYNNRYWNIREIVSSVVGNLSDFYNKVTWLWDHGRNVIETLLWNAQGWIWDRLPQWVRDGLSVVNENLSKIQRLFGSGFEFIARLLDHPVETIINLIPQEWRVALAAVAADLKYLAWLFGEAKELLVLFLANPREFIKGYIFEPLLDWLLEAIAEAW